MSKKVTAAEALNSIDDKYESIDIQRGHLRVNKTWMKVCGTIGAVSAGIGVAAGVVTSFTLVPVLTIGLGVAATGASAYFHHDNNKELDELAKEERATKKYESKIEARQAAKVKTR